MAGGLLGLFALGHGYNRLQLKKPIDFKKIFVGLCILLLGAAMLWFYATALYLDFADERPVLEGRVRSVRTQGARHTEYVADIAGRTVKVTAPVYERLKLLPVVRVEVGRGSGYVYNIEYLAN